MSIDSGLHRLVRARDLLRFSCFEEAAQDFEELARCALPAAPDLWFEAACGLADCFRLRRDYARASPKYYEVLARYSWVSRVANGGRLVMSNRYSAGQSL